MPMELSKVGGQNLRLDSERTATLGVLILILSLRDQIISLWCGTRLIGNGTSWTWLKHVCNSPPLPVLKLWRLKFQSCSLWARLGLDRICFGHLGGPLDWFWWRWSYWDCWDYTPPPKKKMYINQSVQIEFWCWDLHRHRMQTALLRARASLKFDPPVLVVCIFYPDYANNCHPHAIKWP